EHDRALLDREVDDVLGGDNRLHTGQRFRFGRADRLDARMRMRAAQNLAPDLAWHGGVGGELRAAGDFVHAVGADGALADPLVVGDEVHWAASLIPSRISAAGSSPARTVFSYPVARPGLAARQN